MKALGAILAVIAIAIFASGTIKISHNPHTADAAPGEPDRTDCTTIRADNADTGGGYHSHNERVWFLRNCGDAGAQRLADQLEGKSGATSALVSTGSTAKTSGTLVCGNPATGGFINKAGPVTVSTGCSIYGWYTVMVNGKEVYMFDEKAKTTVVATCFDAGGCLVNVKYDGGTRIVADPSTAKCGSGTDCMAVYYASSLSKEATARSNGSTTTTPTLQAQTTSASNVNTQSTTSTTNVSVSTAGSTNTTTTTVAATTNQVNRSCPITEPKYIKRYDTFDIPAGCTAVGFFSLWENGAPKAQYTDTILQGKRSAAVTCTAGCVNAYADWGGVYVTNETSQSIKNKGCQPGICNSIEERIVGTKDTSPPKQQFDDQDLRNVQDVTCASVGGQWIPVGKGEFGFIYGNVTPGTSYSIPSDVCFYLGGHAVNQQGLPAMTR